MKMRNCHRIVFAALACLVLAALAGLASGDIANMAYNMQIAFATTVVGCVCAGISLLIASVKKHWYTEEIADLRYVLDRHLEEKRK